ncbi:Ubiquitin domain containing protein, partial [Trema orientale]
MASLLQKIEGDESVLLRVTHSNLKSFNADVRFSLQTTVEGVKEKLWRKCGTSMNSMALELYDDTKSKISDLSDNSTPLGYYSPLDGYRIHVIDLDPSSVTSGGWLEDTSLVEKYTISDEAYQKRDGTFRKFKEKIASQNPSAFEAKITDSYMEELCANIK